MVRAPGWSGQAGTDAAGTVERRACARRPCRSPVSVFPDGVQHAQGDLGQRLHVP